MSGASSEFQPFALAELITPLSPQTFLAEHWRPGRAYLAESNARLVETLTSHRVLADPAAVVAALAASPAVADDIAVFGKDSFRGTVAASSAMKFWRAGFTLYMERVHLVAPEAAALFARVCAELGFFQPVYLEAFASRAGAVSSWHYDHDTNFQILLSGEKEWLVAPNTNIVNPLKPFHPSPGPDGALRGFREELYARDPAVPHRPSGACETLRATAGTVVFLPRGHWHQVRASTDCFGVNLVVKSTTWAAAIAEALRHRLEAHEDMRAYVAGMATATTIAEVIEDMERHYPALKQLAQRELAELTLPEVPLAADNVQLAWGPDTGSRRFVEREGVWLLELPELFDEPLEVDDDLAPFIQQLVRLKYPFSWSQLLKVRGELEPTHIRALIERLRENEILVTVSG